MKKIFFLAFCLSFITVAISGATSTLAPKISASPSSVNFGSITLGATSATKVVAIKNTGTSDLHISTISITGTNSAEFEKTGSCGTIAPGGTCPVNVTFAPTTPPYAKKSALLTIGSDDPKKNPLNVKLSGQLAPPKIAATPGSVNFGKLPAGTVSSAKSVTIKNTGLSDLVISSIDIAGTDPGDFSATNHCGTVPNGGSCSIDVVFAPLVPKVTRSATLDISSNDPKKPTLILKLSGSLQGNNTISLPQTGQTTCSDASGTEIPCAGTGQDGALQEGVDWPSLRFMDNGDQTITDDLTGLMWTQDADAPGPAGCSPGGEKSWQEALDYVACLNTNTYLGHNDWRLPNRKELRSLANYGSSDIRTWLSAQGFTNVPTSSSTGYYWYWSSTTNPLSTADAFYVDMRRGVVGDDGKTDDIYFVWPVRTAHPKSDNLPKTGQTLCYNAAGIVITCANTGQDGSLQEGFKWPKPRFKDNGDATITDKLTGLMWTSDGNAPGTAGCTTGVAQTWQDALTYVACLNTNNYLGHNDWRLPNVNEVESLVHFGQSNSATWLNTQGFSNVQAEYYWSSTTYASATVDAWNVEMFEGSMYAYSKTSTHYVWPVRTGPSATVVVQLQVAGPTNYLVDGMTVSIQKAGESVLTGVTGASGIARISVTETGDYNVIQVAGVDASALAEGSEAGREFVKVAPLADPYPNLTHTVSGITVSVTTLGSDYPINVTVPFINKVTVLKVGSAISDSTGAAFVTAGTAAFSGRVMISNLSSNDQYFSMGIESSDPNHNRLVLYADATTVTGGAFYVYTPPSSFSIGSIASYTQAGPIYFEAPGTDSGDWAFGCNLSVTELKTRNGFGVADPTRNFLQFNGGGW